MDLYDKGNILNFTLEQHSYDRGGDTDHPVHCLRVFNLALDDKGWIDRACVDRRGLLTGH